MKTQNVTGILYIHERMRSSANGNPRYCVSIGGNLYRTKPDGDFAYSVPNLENRLVSVYVREYHGWPTIEYGGAMQGTITPPPEPVSTIPQAMSHYAVKKSTTVDDMWYWQHEDGMMEGHFFTEKEAWHAVLDHILEEKRCHVTKS